MTVTLVLTHLSATHLAVHWSWSWHVFGQTLQSRDVTSRGSALQLQIRERKIELEKLQTFELSHVFLLLALICYETIITMLNILQILKYCTTVFYNFILAVLSRLLKKDAGVKKRVLIS